MLETAEFSNQEQIIVNGLVLNCLKKILISVMFEFYCLLITEDQTNVQFLLVYGLL